MNRLPLRSAPLVFATLLPIAAAILFLPGEFGEEKRGLLLAPDQTALRLVVLTTILSKTLFALGLGVAPLLFGASRLSARSLRGLSGAIVVVVLGLLAVDLEVEAHTGQHVVDFLPYLLDPEALVWAGPGFDVGPALGRVVRALVLAVAPAWAIAWLVERRLEQASPFVGRRVLASLIGLVLVAWLAAPALQVYFGKAGALQRLDEQLPWTGIPSFLGGSGGSGEGGESGALGEAERSARAALARLRPQLLAPRGGAGLAPRTSAVRSPDLLVVVVESLRADALDAATMPRLWSWSQHGLRAEAHRATSNASHYGLFALLYGRSPLLYFETLDAGERPTLPAQLGAFGYERHLLGCSDVAWRGMDRFMGPVDFDVERLRGDSLPDCDRAVVERAGSLLAPGPRPPRFVLALLTSTHFGYHYPPGDEPFQPALPPPNALELDPERDGEALVHRYRNSAHAVDRSIGALLDRVGSDGVLVVVTGDHGEALFDDGTIAHASRLSDAQTRVPFVLFGPGVPAGRVERGASDHGDVLPTLLARLGGPADGSKNQRGRDLLRDAPSPFLPLVAARASRGGEDLVVFVSGDARYAWRLDARRSAVRFLGRWGTDGRPADAAVSGREAREAARWLEAYLTSLAAG